MSARVYRTHNKTQLVAYLIILASGVNISVEGLLRQENNSDETVLHAAVRTGDHQLVRDDLLSSDLKLVLFPGYLRCRTSTYFFKKN